MAHIFKNPKLTDYFYSVDELQTAVDLSKIRSYVQEYEDAKVLCFPNFKLDTDFEFWAGLSTEDNPGFKKMLCLLDDDQEAMIDRSIRKANGPAYMSAPLKKHMGQLFNKILPVYYKIFGGYEFSIKRSVFRLNLTINENLHYDSYKDTEVFPDHFARMFINLDTQPRIWHTSYTVHEIFEKFGHKVDRNVVENASDNRLWRELNHAAFGKGHEWYDGQPRHVAFFEPGDIWVVDSRQVSHQIFYGRRALSIDFVVPKEKMLDPAKHYHELTRRFRKALLAAG